MISHSNSECKFSKYQPRSNAGGFLVLSIRLLLLLSSVKVNAEPTEYQAEAYRTSMKIKIDGILDEADWEKAKPITEFVQVQPDEGEPITQPTVGLQPYFANGTGPVLTAP